MSRIRYIKPGFFRNEDLASLPALTRLCFAGLWTLADRDGRLEDRPRRIKAEVFPYEDADTETMIAALAGAGFLTRYRVGEVRVIQIQNWPKHQRPHKDEPVSKLPMPEDSTQSPVEPTPVVVETPGLSARGIGNGERGTGTGNGDGDAEPAERRARAPVALTGSLPREHLRHSWCSQRGKCVPEFLHFEFVKSIGGEQRAAEQRLRAFYDAVEAGWPEGPIGDDPVKLWRREFAAKFPSVAPVVKVNTQTTGFSRLTPMEQARALGLK